MNIVNKKADEIELSVIIPHYNDYENLTKLLNLNFKNDTEVIVVDDNSQDFDKRFVFPEKLKNFKILRNTTSNKGAGACRNIGLDSSLGKWLVFIDSDDMLTENYYEILSENFRSSSQVIFFTPTSFNTDKNQIGERHLKYKRIINNYLKNQSTKNILQLLYDFDSPCSKLIRRDFLIENSIRFDEIISANDTMCAVRIGYKVEKFEVKLNTYYIINQYLGSLTTSANLDKFDVRADVRVRKYKFLKENLSNKEFNKYQGYKIPIGLLLTTLSKGFGFKGLVRYYRLFRKNSIHVFSIRLLNPMILYDFVKKRL